jgi:hypothetical protein
MTLHIRIQGTDSLSIVLAKKTLCSGFRVSQSKKKTPPDKDFKSPGLHYHMFCQHDQTN